MPRWGKMSWGTWLANGSCGEEKNVMQLDTGFIKTTGQTRFLMDLIFYTIQPLMINDKSHADDLHFSKRYLFPVPLRFKWISGV